MSSYRLYGWVYNMFMVWVKRFVRLLAIFYILFISVFALDAVSKGFVALFMHLIPTFILIAATCVAWKKPKLGGFIFVALGIVFTLWFDTLETLTTFLVISVPLFMLGLFFVWSEVTNVRGFLLRLASVGFLVAIVVFVGSILSIGMGIKEACIMADRFHLKEGDIFNPGDCVELFIKCVDSKDFALEQRNTCVWALGQFGDKRALPVLKKYYTGEPCDHTKFLCQYELEKAIKWCESGKNVLSPLWRARFLY